MEYPQNIINHLSYSKTNLFDLNVYKCMNACIQFVHLQLRALILIKTGIVFIAVSSESELESI